MIDIRFVFAHSLWILGAAVILAAFSYYDWLAREEGRSRRDVWREARGWPVSTSAGLLLVASAFLLMEGVAWWERGVWLAAWALIARDLWVKIRTK
jgi:hypothetical protein